MFAGPIFDSFMGTPLKRTPSSASLNHQSSGKRLSTPASRTHGDRFIPHRSAMDLDVSHFELTRSASNAENANVNASPAKEECAQTRRAALCVRAAAPYHRHIRSVSSRFPHPPPPPISRILIAL